MQSEHITDQGSNSFFSNLPPGFSVARDAAQELLLREYGSVFVARAGVIPPDRVIFRNEDELRAFQSRLEIKSIEMSGHMLELQLAAMEKLLNAKREAESAGLSINPRGSDSARRNYSDTIELWHSRVEPALVHWVAQGKLDKDKAALIRSLAPHDQVAEVFELESQGIFFAKDLSKSIIYSVAPPGASQHLSMLAFDVMEFDHVAVREILADNFWYQTVTSDLPHFTFLGISERELPSLGLKKVMSSERGFWVPDIKS